MEGTVRPAEEALALCAQKMTRADAKAEQEKRLRRAVADVMEEGHTFTAARRNRNVPDAQLREALVAAGWKPRVTKPLGPMRRAFGSSRGHGT
jgi:hypothetical protein